MKYSPAAINRIIQGNRGSGKLASAIAEAVGLTLQELFPEIHRIELERQARRDARKPVRIPSDPAECIRLRKVCKKMMIDLDLKNGSLPALAADLSARMNRQIGRNTLSMVLTGYRSTFFSQHVLSALRDMLTEKLMAASDNIHPNTGNAINF